MLSRKLMDLHYDVSKNGTPSAMADSFFVLTLFFIAGLLEIALYPIWRPIYWLVTKE